MRKAEVGLPAQRDAKWGRLVVSRNGGDISCRVCKGLELQICGIPQWG